MHTVIVIIKNKIRKVMKNGPLANSVLLIKSLTDGTNERQMKMLVIINWDRRIP